MERIFENWKRYANKNNLLTEKLMLKPGPDGWDLYGELVARAYEKAPKFDSSAVGSFESLDPFVDKMFKRIQGVVDIQFVDNDPYINDDHMIDVIQCIKYIIVIQYDV